MAQKARYNISTGRISEALGEYTQSRNIRLIKDDSRDERYTVIIKGAAAHLKAAEIQKKLNEVGYISKTYSRNSLGTRRAYGSRGSFRMARATNLPSRNIVYLKVAAPKPPVSPPPFPDPSGAPVKKPKKKKG